MIPLVGHLVVIYLVNCRECGGKLKLSMGNTSRVLQKQFLSFAMQSCMHINLNTIFKNKLPSFHVFKHLHVNGMTASQEFVSTT